MYDSASRPYQGDEAPIGVFDSGLGGLTVLERLLDVDQVNNATGLYGPDGVPDLAREHFVYLGDQAPVATRRKRALNACERCPTISRTMPRAPTRAPMRIASSVERPICGHRPPSAICGNFAVRAQK